jgi:GWxTD domain-containing protein
MKYFVALLLTLSAAVSAQPLRDINFSYQYDPTTDFSFDLKIVRRSGWDVFYILQLRDTANRTSNYTIRWEVREDLSSKEGTAVAPEDNRTAEGRTTIAGNFRLDGSYTSKILVAKIINVKSNRAWIFYRALAPDYPVAAQAMNGNDVIFKPYVKPSDSLTFGSGPWTVSYYDDNFPTSSPPFAEAQGRVNRGMKTDSTFTIPAGQTINFSKKGLYLLQKDTSAMEGLALRAEDDYPKLGRVPSLAGPMVYVCTKQEYDRLVLAKGEKKTFDRIVLSITSDTDRARKFMRNYFRRVELANQYFTSYKEGWKTDRGMIFIVFGLPDEVFKFSDREVWSYKNDDYNVTFNFSKSPSLFDPENYVLIRDKKYTQTWYEIIDLWRNARF